MSRILVIDDEPAVLRALLRLLHDHDLSALEDPMLALVRLDAGAEYDVILCDVAMPALSGIELYRRAIASRPELEQRFVFVTGNGSPTVDEFLARPGIRTVHKPFDAELLRAVIGLVVAAREEGEVS